jgi:probable F420-dependent oxidoreductase
MRLDMGSVGVWGIQRTWPSGALVTLVAELEELGYGAFWLGGTPGDLAPIAELLAATRTIPIASGIVSVWDAPPEVVAESYLRVSEQHPDRFVLGIGTSHRALAGERYVRPVERMAAFLDVLDARGVPADRRVLAALGPRVLALAGQRTAGAHPYLVTPEHTARAREILGSDALLAPEQKVLLETDRDRALRLARETVAMYLQLPNYTNNLLRLGFTEDDVAGQGSDRLIEGLVAWGDVDAIRTRVRAHHEAGADHVAIQVINPEAERLPAFRALAPALLN